MTTADVVPLSRIRRPSGSGGAPPDLEALRAALARQLDGEVRFDDGSCALYATDGSNYRQVPMGVVIPRHKTDVLATIELCRSRSCGNRLVISSRETETHDGSSPTTGVPAAVGALAVAGLAISVPKPQEGRP